MKPGNFLLGIRRSCCLAASMDSQWRCLSIWLLSWFSCLTWHLFCRSIRRCLSLCWMGIFCLWNWHYSCLLVLSSSLLPSVSLDSDCTNPVCLPVTCIHNIDICSLLSNSSCFFLPASYKAWHLLIQFWPFSDDISSCLNSVSVILWMMKNKLKNDLRPHFVAGPGMDPLSLRIST